MCLGIPGQIVEITDAANDLALVNVGGVRRVINIAFVIDATRPASACVGAWVLVHVGFAMSRLDEQEAARTLALLHELGVAQGEMAEMGDQMPEKPHDELQSAANALSEANGDRHART